MNSLVFVSHHCECRHTAILAGLLLSMLICGSAICQEGKNDLQVVAKLADLAIKSGNAGRGALIYASPTSACLSCHMIGQNGASVGPELSQLATKQTPAQIIESVLWPRRIVADEYKAIAIVTTEGKIIQGYRVRETTQEVEIRDSVSGATSTFAVDDIEDIQEVGTLMPEGLLAAMSEQDKLDLIAFLIDLGKHQAISLESIDSLLSHSHGHHPATFDMPREPLDPSAWPSWQANVNRDRIYDFYGKQARHFRDVNPRPNLLAEYPGLDGGSYGHWGNQSETTWADDSWNETNLGSLMSGVFRGPGVSVARAVCVRLGDDLSVCFDPDTLTYPRVWSGKFLKFSDVRYGFMNGLNQDGPTVEMPDVELPYDSKSPRKYLGFYRSGDRVIFSYRVNEQEYLDAPTLVDGKFVRVVARRDEHPDRDLLGRATPQWLDEFFVRGQLGTGSPYAVDTIPLPTENPWKANLFCGGHDFLSDGSAIVCTMQGDVWRASGINDELSEIRWRRIASGLHQPLGMVIHDDQIYVMGRDQLTRLHDKNGDGEIDFYECFSQSLETSQSGHDFTCGLWRDAEGRFVTVSGKQGVMRIAADGQSAEVLATGLRNSDGLGLLPDGTITLPSSEGDWMPASMVGAIRPNGPVLNRLPGASPDTRGLPFFGRPGGTLAQPPEVPMLYLPRGVDNSSGGQVHVSSDKWGPLQNQLIHLSFGAGSAFLLLRDEFDGWIQAAAVPIAGEFASGVHRGKFNPVDGQLYVSGMNGWGTYTTQPGCFQRVRYTGESAQLPTGFHVHSNGIVITFAQPLTKEIAENAANHFAQAWNYRYSGAYGSAEYSRRQLGLRGHDVLAIRSATVLDDQHRVFLEIPDLQPTNQLHLLVKSTADVEHDLFMTVHRMDAPFEHFPGYHKYDKVVLPHPLLTDLAKPIATKRNPYGKAIPSARPITIAADKNLTFDQPEIRVTVGEPIRLTFNNPDAVPHNWALIKPGQLRHFGELTNKLIQDPNAAANHYLPQTEDVLAYTDVVEPYATFTIYFNAPKEPGRYPYLCTFPGHWMVMNGVLIVE